MMPLIHGGIRTIARCVLLRLNRIMKLVRRTDVHAKRLAILLLAPRLYNRYSL